jgi:hypothetical protein
MSAPNPAINPDTAKVKLSVTKGVRPGKNYAIKAGATFLGRKGPQPVDIDITEQENPGAETVKNRFALIWFDKNGLTIADSGRRVTRLNGTLIPSATRFPLKGDDTVQFGKTVLQVKVTVKQKTGVQK